MLIFLHWCIKLVNYRDKKKRTACLNFATGNRVSYWTHVSTEDQPRRMEEKMTRLGWTSYDNDSNDNAAVDNNDDDDDDDDDDDVEK